MPQEGIEIVQRLRLREKSGSMEFTETKEVSRRSPRELKFVHYIIRLEDLTKSFKWRAYVVSGGVPIWLHAQYLPQGKEKLLSRGILCLKKRSCLPPPALYSDWIARSKYYGGITKQMNYNYPRRWNQWKQKQVSVLLSLEEPIYGITWMTTLSNARLSHRLNVHLETRY